MLRGGASRVFVLGGSLVCNELTSKMDVPNFNVPIIKDFFCIN